MSLSKVLNYLLTIIIYLYTSQIVDFHRDVSVHRLIFNSPLVLPLFFILIFCRLSPVLRPEIRCALHLPLELFDVSLDLRLRHLREAIQEILVPVVLRDETFDVALNFILHKLSPLYFLLQFFYLFVFLLGLLIFL